MTTGFEDLAIELPELSHVGIVVEDLEGAMDRYGRLLGIDPWRVFRFEQPAWHGTTYRGESVEYSMRLAIGTAGEDTIELVEPLDGHSSYDEHLAERGPGLHHVACFALGDPAGTVERFEAAGIPVLQSGSYEGVQIWYLDTREALDGVILETAANLAAMPDPDEVYEIHG